MMYTIAPQELLMEQPQLPQTRFCAFDKGFLELTGSGSNATVTRVISTDPAVYLDPRFAPGSPYKER